MIQKNQTEFEFTKSTQKETSKVILYEHAQPTAKFD